MARFWWAGRALVVAAALCLSACSDDTSDPDSRRESVVPSSSTALDTPAAGTPGVPTVEELREGIVWEGEFTIRIEVWDYCTTFGKLTKSDSYVRTESFSLQTADPVDYGPAARESNPFFVSAGTDPDRGGSVVLALMSTGVVALPGEESDPYILQFWRLAYDDGHLRGTLVEDGYEMGLAFNGFQDDDLLISCQPQHGKIVRPYPMQEGATIDARFTDETVTMVIEGRSYDEARRWRVEAEGTRTAA
jgi:hypothetical protein